MDSTMLLGLQAQRILQRRMDIAANNLANVNTTGFKADALVVEEITPNETFALEGPRSIRFARDIALARDLRQGAIAITGNPLDLAIEGGSYFSVQGPDGPLYTRDGAFTLDATGQLVTRDGLAVLSQDGAPIVIDPRGEAPSIGRDGAIRIAGVEAGRIGLSNFARPGALEKVGDNLWSAEGQPPQAGDGQIVQGALEESNVVAIVEMTNLIQISRAYESASRLARSADDLRQRAIDRLGRA
jgi:flagellar basal-body rod protein FlgF